MNGSPFRSTPVPSAHMTPSRPTTSHHCNAERKHYPSRTSDLSNISRNLFADSFSLHSSNLRDVRSLR